MLENIGGNEIIFLLIIGVLFFGSKKAKEIGKNLGSAKKEFDNVVKEYKDTVGKTDDKTTKI